MTVAYRVSRLSQRCARPPHERDGNFGRRCATELSKTPCCADFLSAVQFQMVTGATVALRASRLSLAYDREGSSLFPSLLFHSLSFPSRPLGLNWTIDKWYTSITEASVCNYCSYTISWSERKREREKERKSTRSRRQKADGTMHSPIVSPSFSLIALSLLLAGCFH